MGALLLLLGSVGPSLMSSFMLDLYILYMFFIFIFCNVCGGIGVVNKFGNSSCLSLDARLGNDNKLL